ncbi:hypothetical protein A7X83_05905 [Stenotrophomonas maltophilia]|uniref:Uncharacterized protein n=1 Tax=Stenotrophomonas maltophilia TaxID=40324 RepID=A0A2W6ICD2_STEMA|nr:hypothetical protein A7X83_05905 [Stenotrophomonas maltophilia]
MQSLLRNQRGGTALVESTVGRLLSREIATKPALRAIVDSTLSRGQLGRFRQEAAMQSLLRNQRGGTALVESTVSRLLSREAATKPALRAIVD